MNSISHIFLTAAAVAPAPGSSCCSAMKDLIDRVIQGVKKIFSCCYSTSPIHPARPVITLQSQTTVPAIVSQTQSKPQMPQVQWNIPEPIGDEPHFHPEPVGPGHSENYQKFMNFYQNCQPNNEGRTIVDYWRQRRFNIVNWLFPLVTPNLVYGAGAPVVDREILQAVEQNPELREKLTYSFVAALDFYGLSFNDHGDIVRINEGAIDHWLNGVNNYHHFSSISRILSSLNTLGCGDLSQKFIIILRDILANEGRNIHRVNELQLDWNQKVAVRELPIN